MKMTLIKLVCILCLLTPGMGAFASPSQETSGSVAVLDFSGENLAGKNWTAGLNDFMEIALQKEGVLTLERRQIQLILHERALRPLTTAKEWEDAKLPGVAYFVSGKVNQTEAGRFEVTVSVIEARTAIVKATLTKRGVYQTDWIDAIQSVAEEIAKQVRIQSHAPRAHSHAEALTWLPEAALPFFKGLDYYTRGEPALAVPYFRQASGKAGQFDEARLWEARVYRQLGLPELAGFASKNVKQKPAPGTNAPNNLPVVAIAGSEDVSEAERAAFTGRIKRSGRYAIFDPASIAATAREIDLQLTGQMAAPLNGRSVWLAVDSTIALSKSNGTLRARQRDLISGELIGEASLSAAGENAFDRLAEAFLKNKPNGKAREDAVESRDPDSHDTPEIMFAKLLRLVKARPNNARYWVALSDNYGDWDSKMWILDNAVRAIERIKTQPDAPFLLASALWRKRKMESWAWLYKHSWSYAEHPVRTDFAKLLEWFPNSIEATTALEEYLPKGANPHPEPKDGRFTGSVFPNILVGLAPLQETPAVPKMTDTQKLARLKDLISHDHNAKAFYLADELLVADKPAIRVEARRVFDVLFKRLQRETDEIAQFNKAFDAHQNETAWKLGERLLECIRRKERLEIIRRCGKLLKDSQGLEAYAHFMREQADKYSDDFDFDPATGAVKPNTIDFEARLCPDYTVHGAPIRPCRWTTSARDMDYAVLMGEAADELESTHRPDLCALVFESMRHNKALPLRNRFTADYDLAVAQYGQEKTFEALDTLRELIRKTDGHDVPIARKTYWSSDQVSGVAFDLFRKIRLFCDEDTDFSKCCGELVPVPVPDPEKVKAAQHLLDQLWTKFTGGVGADNRSVRQILQEQKDQVFPVMLYKVWKGDADGHLLALCTELGTNAAPLLPYLPHYITHNTSFPEYNNALNIFGRIGRPAACSVPFLILAAEGTTSTFNATFSLKAVGPAPKRVMPYLAKLLYHQNPAVCRRAADAIVKCARLEPAKFSGPDLVVSLRQWWEDEGCKKEWAD